MLNMMAHHPEFDGAIERFNRTLKDHPSKASSETCIPIGPVYSQGRSQDYIKGGSEFSRSLLSIADSFTNLQKTLYH